MRTTLCAGQPSWQFASDRVEAAVTRLGGHLAPMRFRLPHGVVEPFSVAPWAEEKPDRSQPAMLRALRGDFFCEFFGGNETVYRGEQHPPHGETANAEWRFESLTHQENRTALRLSLETTVRPGRVKKMIQLRDGETAIYCQHVVSGTSGRLNPGHHATLKFPDKAGSGLVSTSPIRFGQVLPGVFEEPARRGYSALKPGAIFSRLDQVPGANGSVADVSRYPARRGFEDLLMIVHESAPDFAWTAVSFPESRYVWFALKDPRVLRGTVLWISNGGRHYPPWNGRHVNVMGLEDVTAYFHYGLAQSAQDNPLNRRGFPTYISLRRGQSLTVNYIMAVAATPAGFGRVRDIKPCRDHVALTSTDRQRVLVPIDTSFLYCPADGPRAGSSKSPR